MIDGGLEVRNGSLFNGILSRIEGAYGGGRHVHIDPELPCGANGLPLRKREGVVYRMLAIREGGVQQSLKVLRNKDMEGQTGAIKRDYRI